MFLYDLGKNISIQVKSQNLYSFEFTKEFKFLLFFYKSQIFADICIPKFDENSIFINVFIRSR